MLLADQTSSPRRRGECQRKLAEFAGVEVSTCFVADAVTGGSKPSPSGVGCCPESAEMWIEQGALVHAENEKLLQFSGVRVP